MKTPISTAQTCDFLVYRIGDANQREMAGRNGFHASTTSQRRSGTGLRNGNGQEGGSGGPKSFLMHEKLFKPFTKVQVLCWANTLHVMGVLAVTGLLLADLCGKHTINFFWYAVYYTILFCDVAARFFLWWLA